MDACWCWGSGEILEQRISVIKKGLNIIGVVDANPEKWGKTIDNFTINNPNSIKPEDTVLITTQKINSVLISAAELELDLKNFLCWDDKRHYATDVSFAFSRNNYSLDGEEMFLKEKYLGVRSGFYVDVGAHHPFRFSNTQWAYEQGWHGINIDPSKDAIKLFEAFRPKDINLNCGISDESGVMDYYEYDETAMNTFVKNRQRNNGQKPRRIQSVQLKRLDDIFEEYRVSHVDYIDIDVEGMEKNVIDSIDFEKVDIDTILVEQLPLNSGRYTIHDILETPIYNKLSLYGYSFTNKYDRTVIYERIK